MRIKWIHSQTCNDSKSLMITPSQIIATQGTKVSTANYVVEIELGTPKTKQTVVFDTGSEITWVQCQPCAGHCYDQQDQIFDPSKSSTYTNISCNSENCSPLTQTECSGQDNCRYIATYGDGSTTQGFFAQETLTLGPSEVIPGFKFGCGEDNIGIFGETAGLMGLGRKPASIVVQTMEKYGGVFSYCIPTLSSDVGYLTFGNSTLKSDMQYTPILSRMGRSGFYFVEVMSVSVGGKELDIPPAVFENAGAIIDSGTVITRMPPTAYSALRSVFRSLMSEYPMAPTAQDLLDTCYDFSNYTTVDLPTVALNFRGATMDLDPSGIVYTLSASQVCLAFAPSIDDDRTMIVGNTQQRRFNVVYDLMNEMIGFSPRSC